MVFTIGIPFLSGSYEELRVLFITNSQMHYEPIHKETFTSKHTCPALNQVLEDVANVINL